MWRPQGREDRWCISYTIIGSIFNMLMGMISHNDLRFVHKLKLIFVLRKFLPNLFLLLTQLNVVSNRFPHLPVIDWPIPVFKIISKSLYSLLLHFDIIYCWKELFIGENIFHNVDYRTAQPGDQTGSTWQGK